jgi:hypothetical protein
MIHPKLGYALANSVNTIIGYREDANYAAVL